HAKEEGVISLFTDPCLADFFDELIGDLNFTEYEDQGWQFLSMYDPKVQAYAHYMQYPEPYSFSIFAKGFLHYVVNHSYSRLYVKTKRLFGLIYSKKSIQKFLQEEKNLFEQIYKKGGRSVDPDNNNKIEEPDAKTREWGLFERKTFAIALWRVRSYLASQKRGSMALKISLLALAEDLDLLVMREYVLEKKHQGGALGPQYTCEQYRQFLKAACLTYFFLKYISKFYDEEAFLDTFDRYIETPFFSNFFNDLIEDLDFEEYLMQDFDFFLDISNKTLNIKSPVRLGFLVLSSLCLQHALENDNSKLFKTMDKLLGFLFGHALYQGAFHSKVLLDQFEIEKNKTGDEEERCLSSKILIEALL
ncbi:hypothetical protein JKY79_03710, partial [Candidatus Babeliales bacterium]|nr:hypothetical protein [Candidatus Babeliales bacterium]